MIDDDQSVLVVVPTSAGKTFSSFYVISRMLQKIKLEKEKSLTKAGMLKWKKEEKGKNTKQEELNRKKEVSKFFCFKLPLFFQFLTRSLEREATCLTARVVFVAPTLPLANQMQTDIYHRYGKERRCGVYTTEFNSNVRNAEVCKAKQRREKKRNPFQKEEGRIS